VRIGRLVRVRREAIDAMAVPVTPKEVVSMREAMPLDAALPGSPSTEAQLRERQQAIADSAASLARMRGRLDGKRLEPSWSLIREAREERSGQI
jgi:hypothetical protein